MHVSQEQKGFSQFFGIFFKSTLNFEILEKIYPHSLCISEITDSERRGYINV